VITNIGIDHREFLGNTITEIAYEKAGIIKPTVPVITASRIPEVIMRLTETAEGRGSRVNIYGKEFSGTVTSMDKTRMTLEYEGDKSYGALTVPVTGTYQLYNTCMAIRSTELLRQKGYSISDDAIRSGLRKMTLEGRLEWVSQEPPIILDCAHNAEAAHALAGSIRELFPGKKIILVAGIMDDKDIRDILYPLVQFAELLILTKAKYERAASSEKLREIVSSMPESHLNGRPDSIISTESVDEALHIAKMRCGQNSIILVTGSFYTAGEVKELLGCTGPLSGLRE
jgi:dihydrofolate synthase/folylpolyglutamate synthase